jgi:LPXTG-site transpeptidase (sortase) family protein
MGQQRGRPSGRRRAATFIGGALFLAGAILILAAVGMQLFTMYADFRWARAQEELSRSFVPLATAAPSGEQLAVTETATPEAPPTATPSSTPPLVTMALTLTPVSTVTQAGGLTVTPSPQPTSTSTRTPTRTPTPLPTIPSDPGRLIIPAVGVDAPIVKVPLVKGEWDLSHIIYEVALLAGTGFPGQPGNAALSGHVTLKGRGNGPFRWIEKLVPDDEIIVQQGNTRYSFRVTSVKTVLPTDVSVLAPTQNATLTLITCTDWDFVRAEYTKRLIASATLTGKRDISVPAQ